MIRNLIRKFMPEFINDLHKEGIDDWLIHIYYNDYGIRDLVHILETDEKTVEYKIIFKE